MQEHYDPSLTSLLKAASTLANKGKETSEPSLSEAEGSGPSWLVGMRALGLSVFLFTGILALQGKENSEPSLTEAEGTGTC